jgi:heme/copper-type cytochrome/quinol oxidase subunit 2
MQNGLAIALYGVIGILFLVLAAGVINLLRTDKNARSRSNHLMRLRVAVQAVAVLIIVIIGWVSGAFGK